MFSACIVVLVQISGNIEAQQITQSEAVARARRFVREISYNALEPGELVEYKTALGDNERSAGALQIQFRNCFVSIDLDDGRVRGYKDNRSITPWLHRQNQRDLIAKANQYFQAAGFDGNLQLYLHSPESGYEKDGTLQMQLLRTVNGIPYTEDFGVEFELDQSTGRLIWFGVQWLALPEAPRQLTPKITLEMARRIAFKWAFATNARCTELYEHRALRLGIWRPPSVATPFQEQNLKPEHTKFGLDNKGVLVYWGTFINRPDLRIGTYAYRAYFDANTGELLAAWHNPRGERVLGRKHPFAWDLGPAPMTLAIGKKFIEVNQGRIERSTSAPKESDSSNVMLLFGKMSLNCRYFPKSSLLGITRDGVTTYGRPDKSVLQALAKLTTPPSANR